MFDKINLVILNMATLIIHPENEEKLEALKAFMTAFKIRFEEDESTYDPEFIEKIKRSDEDFKSGKFKSIKTDDLWR